MSLFATLVSTVSCDTRPNVLELVQSLLPAAIALNSNLHTAKDHFLSTSKVYSELDNVSILYPERLGFDVGLAQPNVVEECPRRALDVLDVPAPVFAPELAMLPADDLGLEANGCGRGRISWVFRRIVAL